jgi:hypothetical protein
MGYVIQRERNMTAFFSVFIFESRKSWELEEGGGGGGEVGKKVEKNNML